MPLLPRVLSRIASTWRNRLVRIEPNVFMDRHAAGHYCSPIPDLAEVLRRADRLFPAAPPRTVPGITMREQEQRRLIEEVSELSRFDMAESKETAGSRRFFANNTWFTPMDARVVVGMIRRFGSRRVIEIGSGFSTAAMLDGRDLFGLQFHVTAIEPMPCRLHELLGEPPADFELITALVQDVDVARFEQLEAGDLLFVDSSHVVKIGSDVNHIVFEVLPRLKPGVIVHFHDVLYPFEYPRDWLEKGFAWNEAYLLRAFLQYNDGWKILLYNAFLGAFYRDDLARMYYGHSCSGGLYIQRS